jgi:hypothetical protein
MYKKCKVIWASGYIAQFCHYWVQFMLGAFFYCNNNSNINNNEYQDWLLARNGLGHSWFDIPVVPA